jgi:hypothetical protein
MDIPILIEMVPGGGFRASSGPPLALSAEGDTQPEAVRKLEALLRAKLDAGAWLDVVSLPSAVENPILRSAGIFSDKDPMVQEWLAIMAENRRAMDAEEEDLP